MMYRVAVRVDNGIDEMRFISNDFPFEIFYKQRPHPLVHLIERLRIATKKISELF